ncbi:MAG: hypothetical protein A2506_05835 [Elusimicrobia bacterium RIFOXYD12_FULL_66_9]|nr:MAG: hypothetical protein A2506_05835 [Elusimicrobia bacterium RIFOXYD12_FULL_66_9]
MTLWAVALAGAVAVVFAGVMLFHRSLYVSAVCLLVVLLQTGVIFLLRGAPLLGLIQVMVYAGAVMVLVVVTIMASGGGAGDAPRFADFSFPRWLAFLGLAAALLEGALTLRGLGSAPVMVAAAPGLSAAFGQALFTSYALATEAVTLLMFLASLAIAPDREAV